MWTALQHTGPNHLAFLLSCRQVQERHDSRSCHVYMCVCMCVCVHVATVCVCRLKDSGLVRYPTRRRSRVGQCICDWYGRVHTYVTPPGLLLSAGLRATRPTLSAWSSAAGSSRSAGSRCNASLSMPTGQPTQPLKMRCMADRHGRREADQAADMGHRRAGPSRLTAAIPMENPYCSCKSWVSHGVQLQSLWRIPAAAVS